MKGPQILLVQTVNAAVTAALAAIGRPNADFILVRSDEQAPDVPAFSQIQPMAVNVLRLTATDAAFAARVNRATQPTLSIGFDSSVPANILALCVKPPIDPDAPPQNPQDYRYSQIAALIVIAPGRDEAGFASACLVYVYDTYPTDGSGPDPY